MKPTKPSNPNDMLQQAVALRDAGKWKEAAGLYRQLLALAPGHPQLLTDLGTIMLQLGDAEEGVRLLGASIEANPGQPLALSNRAVGLRNLGRFDEALESVDRAIALMPGYADAYNNRGLTLHELARMDEALQSYDQAIQLQPGHAAAHHNRGRTLRALGRFEEALQSYDQAIALFPGNVDCHNDRGATLRELGRYDEALESHDRAIGLQPGNAEAYNSRGMALHALQRHEEALASYERALALDSRHADAYCNRGVVLFSLKRLDEAQESYRRAIALQPEHVLAHLNEAILRLTLGDYDEGWKLYEWRWRGVRENIMRYFPEPLWLGEQPLSGKTLLIYAEQGYGDFIQMCRYAQLAESQGAKVVLQAPPALTPLAATLSGSINVVATGQRLPAFDYQCPIMSLPLAFKTRVATIPAPIPYLHVSADRQTQWRRRLGGKTRARVGVAWSGNVKLRTGQNRILPLRQLKPLLDLPFEFHALQKEFLPEDAAQLSGLGQIRLHHDELRDFADTAALIGEMDLVISVDTAAAHLAGAMGKPLWVVLPYMADWRWMLDRADNPWYPTATLFRQPAIGDWAAVVLELEKRLQTL